MPPSAGQLKELWMPANDFVLPELQAAFDTTCQQQLCNFHLSLQTISIYGVLPLAWLSLLILPKVFKLKITTRYQGVLDQLWNSICSTDFDKIMPGLKEVEKRINTKFPDLHSMRPLHHSDWYAEWPAEGNAPYKSSV